MSTTSPLPPIPRPGGSTAAPTRGKRSARRRRWPAWVIVVVSLAGIVVAIVAWNIQISQTRQIVAICGFAVASVAGTAMLFVQRVLDVGVARVSGTPLISSFGLADKFAFGLLLIASVANGIVFALEVARQ